MRKIKYIPLRLLTLVTHPSTILYYSRFRGTIIYPGVILKMPSKMKILNSVITRKCSIKCFNNKNNNQGVYISINNSYIADRAYISSNGGLYINRSIISPNVFIGTYKHTLTKRETDTNYVINIDNPKFIGQNVSIFGNVNIGKGAVIGACAVITKNVYEYTMVVGNPAKPIKSYSFTLDEWIDIG